MKLTLDSTFPQGNCHGISGALFGFEDWDNVTELVLSGRGSLSFSEFLAELLRYLTPVVLADRPVHRDLMKWNPKRSILQGLHVLRNVSSIVIGEEKTSRLSTVRGDTLASLIAVRKGSIRVYRILRSSIYPKESLRPLTESWQNLGSLPSSHPKGAV